MTSFTDALNKATNAMLQNAPSEAPTKTPKEAEDSKTQRAVLRTQVDRTRTSVNAQGERKQVSEEIGGITPDQLMTLSPHELLTKITGLENEELAVGKTMNINFFQNKEIQHAIGLAMIFSEEITEVSVNGKKGKRRGPGGNFYLEDGSYLKILEGDTVKIETMITKAEADKIRKEMEDSLKKLDKSAEITKIGPEQIAVKYGIDVKLLRAMKDYLPQGESWQMVGKYLQIGLASFETITIPYSETQVMTLLSNYGLDMEGSFTTEENTKKIVEAYLGRKAVAKPAERSSSRSTETKPKTKRAVRMESSVPEHEKRAPLQGQICNRNTRNYRSLIEDHKQNLNILKIDKTQVIKNQLQKFVSISNQNIQKYLNVSNRTGVPWKLIAAIHHLEGGQRFNTYLHNGQKLGKPTTIVPKGILFHDWEEAAVHALKSENLPKPGENDLAAQLAFAERYNGLGYRFKGRTSLYVYGGTNIYQGGKFVADGKFDPNARSKYAGAAALLLSLNNYANESGQTENGNASPPSL